MVLPPVILLHGWGGTFASIWESAGWPAALEAVGRKAIAIDLPGHGRPSSPDPRTYADLAGTLDAALPDGTLDVVGFSLGAKLALAIAARQPGRFGRIVLGGVGDNLFAPEPSGDAVAAALVEGVTSQTAPAVAALVRYAGAPDNDPAALAAILRRPANPIVTDADLAHVTDVLLVNGDADTVALPDARLVAALPGVRAVRLSGVDHLALPASQPFRALALDHLQRDGSRRREEP